MYYFSSHEPESSAFALYINQNSKEKNIVHRNYDLYYAVSIIIFLLLTTYFMSFWKLSNVYRVNNRVAKKKMTGQIMATNKLRHAKIETKITLFVVRIFQERTKNK